MPRNTETLKQDQYCPFQDSCKYYTAQDIDFHAIEHTEIETTDEDSGFFSVRSEYRCKVLPEGEHCSYLHMAENAEAGVDFAFKILHMLSRSGQNGLDDDEPGYDGPDDGY